MLPELKTYHYKTLINYIFRKDITIDEFVLDKNDDHDGEELYYLSNGTRDNHLTKKEYFVVKEALQSFPDKLNVFEMEGDVFGDYVNVFNIQIPMECYDVDAINNHHSKYKNGDQYFDFDECGDYFITSVKNLHYMTLLINDAIEQGYYLLFRDYKDYVVEMSKIQKINI